MALSSEATAVALVKQLFATSFIGFSVATALYGISVLQVYLYHTILPKLPYGPRHVEMSRACPILPLDNQQLLVQVAFLFTLDTLSTIFVSHALYTYFILNFDKNPLVDLVIPWTFSTEKLLVTLITFVAQCFYAQAIWKALGIVTSVDIFTIKEVSETKDFVIISGCVQGLAALNDVLITVAMCYYLQHNRSGLPSTNQFVDTVILYSVSRGVLTATTQILFLITNVAFPDNTYYQPFHQTVGKLYVNATLATLNLRRTFQPTSQVQYSAGLALNFHHEGPGQSLSVEPQHNTIHSANLATPNTNNPDHEQKPPEKTNFQV
ncbi:hypothetical protein C8R44DRAFT_820696 [Mycena epipterygia]|nr:hypothetical protein C8R44DRAFT_820696 [Mycena epipterygia]